MAESYFKQRVRRTGGLSLREDLGIAVATVAIALTTLDRQSAGEKGLDAFGYGLGAAVVWQLARWAVRFLVTVPREMHNEAVAERDRALARVAELEARKPITAADRVDAYGGSIRSVAGPPYSGGLVGRRDHGNVAPSGRARIMGIVGWHTRESAGA